MAEDEKKFNVGIYVFNGMTILDGYAPLQLFAYVPAYNAFTFAKTKDRIVPDMGITVIPEYGFDDCPPIDILVVPGGGDPTTETRDQEVLDFIKEKGESAQYVTSVCTGSLILAEAGLLDGYKSACHWAYKDFLRTYDQVEVTDDRVTVDRNRISGGGITAGLDFGLRVIAETLGQEAAQTIQLIAEYDPHPPFNAGSPQSAPKALVESTSTLLGELFPGPGEFYASRM